jgi:hypothetical protein
MAHDGAVPCERYREVVRTEFMQERSRTFDVGEQEGDGPGGKVVPQGGLDHATLAASRLVRVAPRGGGVQLLRDRGS